MGLSLQERRFDSERARGQPRPLTRDSLAITLRPATQDDHDFLFHLHRASMRHYVDSVWGWEDGFQATYFREHFEPGRLRIIEMAGHAVGVIGFDLDSDLMFIGPFEVDPSAQGRGVGTAALAELFKIADEARVPTTLQVLRVNPEALRLYRRLGFEVVGDTETHFLMRRPPTETTASDPTAIRSSP